MMEKTYPLAALFLLSVFLILAGLSSSSATVSVNLTISPQEAWWKEQLNATGTVINANSAPVSGATVNVTVLSNNCTATTDASGHYSCNITGPSSLGDYTATALTNDSAGLVASASTGFSVALNYGPQVTGPTDRAVYETPLLIQEPSGGITKAIIRVLVWRG